jgi:hypothetical protein
MNRFTLHANQLTSLEIPFVEEGANPTGTPTGVSLRARQRDQDVVVLDKPAAAIGARTATVEIAPADILPGVYRGWLHLEFPSSIVVDTSEFDLTVLEHAPGEGIRTGRVYRLARLKIPVAWDALKRYPDYGDVGLTTLIQLNEVRVLGLPLTIAEENGLDARVANYIAHLAAVEAIPAAIDYWTNQIVSQTARGADEVHTFPDRIRANEEQLKRLNALTDKLRLEAEEGIGKPLGRDLSPTLLDGGEPITPSLDELRNTYSNPDWAEAF